jgi:hypothetical protein
MRWHTKQFFRKHIKVFFHNGDIFGVFNF